jgi:hypothetical protein
VTSNRIGSTDLLGKIFILSPATAAGKNAEADTYSYGNFDNHG